MSDWSKIMTECRAAQAEQREISDACARMIAAMYHSDNIGASFSTTGAITGDVYYALFYIRGERMTFTPDESLAADMLATYLLSADDAEWDEDEQCYMRGPVAGWSALWL